MQRFAAQTKESMKKLLLTCLFDLGAIPAHDSASALLQAGDTTDTCLRTYMWSCCWHTLQGTLVCRECVWLTPYSRWQRPGHPCARTNTVDIQSPPKPSQVVASKPRVVCSGQLPVCTVLGHAAGRSQVCLFTGRSFHHSAVFHHSSALSSRSVLHLISALASYSFIRYHLLSIWAH